MGSYVWYMLVQQPLFFFIFFLGSKSSIVFASRDLGLDVNYIDYISYKQKYHKA